MRKPTIYDLDDSVISLWRIRTDILVQPLIRAIPCLEWFTEMSEAVHKDLILLEEAVWIAVDTIGLPIYDFSFRAWFRCRSPYERPQDITAIARVGAVADYDRFYQECKQEGISLVHSPAQHIRASQLDAWYPLLSDITPRSAWFKTRPTLAQVKAQFGWPVFMKGARQTSRHQRKLSIIESDADFLRAIEAYARDPILAWQDVVCREYVALRQVCNPEEDPTKMPRSFEFRTFWWKKKLVGAGRYWWEGPAYNWSAAERDAACALAAEAAQRVDVPFLVVDLAQASDGRWIVIECNDAQESGYAGVSAFTLWQQIVDLERPDNKLAERER